MKPRAPAVAGLFYPHDAEELGDCVRRLLAGNRRRGAVPKVLIAPHAGLIYSGPTAACAYSLLPAAAARIRRVILLGPSHRVPLRGLAAPQAGAFRTPLGDVAVDREAISGLKDLPQVSVSDAPHMPEHSLEVQLPFLQVVLGDFTVVPLVVGLARPAEVAEVLDRLWNGDQTLIVVSSDLSHYHAYDTARNIDAVTSRLICELTENLNGEQACGSQAINGLMHCARHRGMRACELDLRNSGDTAGPPDRVVGYGAFALYEA